MYVCTAFWTIHLRDHAKRVYPWAVTISMAMFISLTIHLQVLHFIDCIFMILALETNRILIPRLQSEGVKNEQAVEHKRSSYVACCIGYQETEENWRACLRSYKAHANHCKTYIVALDGSIEENSPMAEIFQEEFGMENGGHVISYEQPLGHMYDTFIKTFRKFNDGRKDDGGDTAKSYAFKRTYDYVRGRVLTRVEDIAKLANKDDVLPAIMVLQPHVGLKAIRFAAFVTSMVVADILDVDFMWSSDSDTRIAADCIENIVAALIGDESAGAGSASISVCDRDSSLFNKVYGGHYQNEDHLRWSAGGCIRKSGNCQGPATCFRVKAIKEVVGDWYMQRIAGERVVR